MKTITIAEIGINYAYGDDKKCFIQHAKDLIYQSLLAGFDYVKFQKRNPDICVPEDQKNTLKSVPWNDEKITYLQYKKDIEFSIDEYSELVDCANNMGIGIFSSVWDIDSVLDASKKTTRIDKFNKTSHNNGVILKIPSALITDTELLKIARKHSDILMISTGMSSEKEIEYAIKIGNPDVVFHTNSEYPSPIEDLNLNYINHLKNKYPNIIIGYSGHDFGISTTIATVAMGVTVIERHVTLDRNLWGSDQLASVEPVGMYKLIKGIKELEIAMGDPYINDRIITEGEILKRKTLRK